MTGLTWTLPLDATFGTIEGGVALWDAKDTLVMANRRFAELFGLPPERIAPGMAYRAFIALACESGDLDGQDPDEAYEAGIALVRRRKPVTCDEQMASGRVIRKSYRPVDRDGWIATYEDVTEQQRAQAQIAFMASHDSLTKLANRELLLARLREGLARVGDIAVLYLDLDRFKEVNDTLGHPSGDALLRFVAARLSNCFRQSDTVARLGGDEFAVIIAPGPRETATAAAQQVIEALSRPFEIEGQEITISTSVGIVLAPADGTDPETLLKNADQALYAAKGDGRGTLRFFEQSMNDRLQARRTLEIDLRAAIAQDGLALFYQPLVSTHSGAVSGFEALLRWRHPTRGLVSPAEFIPVADTTRLIVPLGAWSIRRACIDLARLPPPLRMAVNLSPVQFRSKDLLPTIREVLAATGVAPHRLELEVTESTLMKDTETAGAVLRALRDLGVRIAMDDFGTGYSSLSYLRSFPFDKIKIDKSFIDDLGRRRGSEAIVRAVTGIADSLGIETVAEGVESREQYRQVVAEGCDQVQGFLFSRAVPMELLPRVISTINGGVVKLQRDTGRPAQVA